MVGRLRTCRSLVAAAGYGKTTTLRRLFAADRSRWGRGETRPCEFIADAVAAGERQIVLDDLPRLPPDTVRALLLVVNELPDTVTVAFASRWPLASRWPGVGRWTELGPADLALGVEQVAELISDEYGLAGAELAGRVHEATGGWPALVHLAAESLRSHGIPPGPLAAALAQPGGALSSYVTEEVLAGLPEEALGLLRHVGELSPVTAGLGAALGQRDADEAVALLRRCGVLARVGAVVPGLPAPAERVVPVLAEIMAAGQRRVAGSTVATATKAAQWYEEHALPAAAAREWLRAGAEERCARVLDEHGDQLISIGQSELVLRLITALPERLRTRRLWLLLGDALRTTGDLEAAGRAYDVVAAGEPDWTAGLAWRVGRIHYQRGDAHQALAAFARGGQDCASPDDLALLLSWTANAHLLAGDGKLATTVARRATAVAVRAGSGGALATAYLSVALCLAVGGDLAGSEEHFALALPIAERTGDVLLLTRIHTNRTYQLLQTARYAGALSSARLCVRYAQAAGSASLLAIATSNEAEALAMLGSYDDAVRRYQAALAHYQRNGSRRYAAALLGLGELYRRRGWREQARAAYEEAVRVTEANGNAHILVPALAGLALVVLADDAKSAAAHAETAAGQAGQETIGSALLAQGWIAVNRSERDLAEERATEAARVARAQHDRAGLADALELRAAIESEPSRVRAALREALAIWTEAGAQVEAARIAVVMSRQPGADPEDRANGLLAALRLATAGALVDRLGVGPSGVPAGADRTAVAIRALGRFEVHLGGQPVPASQWQSRKARDLLRILVARRGRPVPRGELCELLWPEGDADRTGHRLSVLLSIVRGVLDPAKVNASDHYLIADQSSIALDIATAEVDVEDFLAQVAHGRRLVEREALAAGQSVLQAADQLYRAEAFEDEPYAEWAGPLREEARAAYLSMLRMLAHTSRVTAGPSAAAGYLLRLLECDPYDEPAHRALVRALVTGGQHGEARRAFTRYGEAMRAIGVRPPDNLILVPPSPQRDPSPQ